MCSLIMTPSPLKVLVILGHLRKDSLCGALADSFVAGARQADVDLKRLDLCELKFNPNVVAGSVAGARPATLLCPVYARPAWPTSSPLRVRAWVPNSQPGGGGSNRSASAGRALHVGEVAQQKPGRKRPDQVARALEPQAA
jgi:hypothetical protein